MATDLASMFSSSVDTATLVESGAAREFVKTALGELARRRRLPPPVVDGEIVDEDFAVAPEDTYAAKYNAGLKYYYSYFDEALFDDYQNALAMRRDGLWQELLDHRRFPTCGLDHDIECDDPDDPEQVACCKLLDLHIKRIPRFQDMKLWLFEDLFAGKSGVQVKYGYTNIKGQQRINIVDHAPLQGDKIIFKFDGTPGVLVYGGPSDSRYSKEIREHVYPTDRGTVFPLYNQFWRDRFIISRYQSSDFDYLFEGQQAQGRFGYGLRGRYYWAWNLRTEALGWVMDALQRVGASGMTYGTYEASNPEARAAMEQFIKNLTRNQWALAPIFSSGQIPDIIKNIPVSAVGYDILLRIIEYLDGIMRRGVLGQNLSSQSAPTGLGSGVADLQGDVREDFLKFDATRAKEILNDQLVERLVRLNRWYYRGRWYRGDQLSFEMRLKFQIDKKSGPQQVEAAATLHGIGIDLDKEDLLEQAGLEAPKDRTNALPGATPPDPRQAGAAQKENVGAGRAKGLPALRPPTSGVRSDAPEQFHRSDDPEASRWRKMIGRTDVVRLLMVQRGNRRAREQGKPGYGPADLERRWVPSEYFTLMQVPVRLGTPSHRVKPGDRTYSRGPIVLDRNLSQIGEPFDGYDRSVLVVDGKHRQAAAIDAGEPSVWAWVGNRALADVVRQATRDDQRNEAEAETYAKGDDTGPGVLISLNLPNQLARSLELMGHNQAEELHLTLFYLGKLTEIGPEKAQTAREVCRLYAANLPPLGGRITGVGRFPASETSSGKDVIYAAVDIPELAAMRDGLAACLEFAGVKWKQDHAFTPHITLAYLAPGEPSPVDSLPEHEFTLAQLAFAIGDERETFWLNGGEYDYEFYQAMRA